MKEDNVYDLARQLASALKSSQQYRRYQETKDRIAQDEKSLQLIEEFHRKQIKYQKQQLSGKQMTEKQQEELAHLQDILQLKPQVREFLQAEVQLARMVADVQQILSEALDIGTVAREGQAQDTDNPAGDGFADFDQC